jgi:serine/threonine protein kinase
MDKSYIFLKSPIGSGGEANIYTVRIRPELVAKVYKKPHGDYARKLAFMIANPPVDPLASSGRVSIAWATELVTDLGLVVGFLMPKLDTSKAKPIFQYYNPSERRKESPKFSYVSLLRTARNLARAVRSVHSRGYVIGDVNESNVLVADDAIVTLVDTDSFQVNDGTTVYRCTVGKPEYTPPELQGMSFRDVDRSVEHDLFGLGVLIYQLLMEGTHPFGGVFRGQGEAPELKDRIKAGHFPHGRGGVPYKPMPLAPSFQMLPVALQELFLLCFEVGHGNPAARPTAEVWSKALGEAEDGLVTCGVNGQHHYSGHLGVCPWCERAVKLRGRDPFPALGVISSGQRLKPVAIGKAFGKPILKPFFPSNMSGTQQSQIASLQSSTVTNSQVPTLPNSQTISQLLTANSPIQPTASPQITISPSISQSSRNYKLTPVQILFVMSVIILPTIIGFFVVNIFLYKSIFMSFIFMIAMCFLSIRGMIYAILKFRPSKSVVNTAPIIVPSAQLPIATSQSSIPTNNNQQSIKRSLWENFFHTIHSPNLSLITRLFLICYGVYFFVMLPLLSIYVIVIGIQGMNAFALTMGGIGLWGLMYVLFTKKIYYS